MTPNPNLETSLLNEPPERPARDRCHRARFDRSARGDEACAVARPPSAVRRRAPLGADDGPIEIVEYNPSWPVCFVKERERLAPLLPGVHLHHIGSTAVPALAAKPVIDMIAFVDALDATAETAVQRASYEMPASFNANLAHRRFLCHPRASFRTHHLHLVDERAALERCLRFRDMLRADATLARQYATLKRGLAARFKEDRRSYTEAKTGFIGAAKGTPESCR
jgi:GrpB-like predicted nucleotidyltransferase (UPF0157 family)